MSVAAESTVAELTRELLRVRGPGLLDKELDQLDDASINNVARFLLARFRAAYGGRTLRSVLADPYFATWLDESCSRSDHDALVHQLRIRTGTRITQAGGVDDPARLVAIERVPNEYVKLAAWPVRASERTHLVSAIENRL